MSAFKGKLLAAGNSLDREVAMQCDSLLQPNVTNALHPTGNNNATQSMGGIAHPPPPLNLGACGQNNSPLILAPFPPALDIMQVRLQMARDYVSIRRLERNFLSEQKYELDMVAIGTAASTLRCKNPIPLHCGPSAEEPMVWDNLPASLVNVVRGFSEFTGFPPIASLLALLTSLSAATCGRFKVTVHEGWSESAALYTAIGSPSGTKKSSFLEKIQQPLLDFERSMQAVHAKHFDSNRLKAVKKASQKIHHAELSKIMTEEDTSTAHGIKNVLKKAACIHKETSLAEENLGFVEQAMPRLFAQNTTAKRLYQTISENGNAIAFFLSELHSLLTLFNTPKANLDIFLQAYNHENFSYEIKSRTECLIYNPIINQLLVTQPIRLHELYSNAAAARCGLTPRFSVYFCGQNAAPNEASASINHYYSVYKDKIIALLSKHYTQSKTKELLHINCSSAARDKLLELDRQYSNALVNLDDSDGYKAHTGKAHGLIARFAALLHIWQHDDPTWCEIQLSHVEAATSLFAALQNHAQYAFAVNGLTA